MKNIIETKNISISFGGIKAVQNLSFEIHEGEILGLIGSNGSRKSTVVNLISGAYTLDSGTIIFDGKEILNKMGAAVRAKLGMGRTFQAPQPFSALTVHENVYTIALQTCSKAAAHKKTEEILKETKLEGFADMQSSKLPIEKRKWLDLARILANDPKFIMLDEVMARLNPSEMEESLEVIVDINKNLGVTFLFIEHVMKAIIKICSRCIVINEGKFLAQGVPEEVLVRKDVISAYIGGMSRCCCH